MAVVDRTILNAEPGAQMLRRSGMMEIETDRSRGLRRWIRPRPGRSLRVKSDEAIARMRDAGLIVSNVLDAVAAECRPGVTTAALDALGAQAIRAHGAEGLFHGYASANGGSPFPGHLCISVNEEVVHGVPGERTLMEGDIITIDCGVRHRGWCADSARTIRVGEVDAAVSRMLDQAEAVLATAIEMIRPGRRWSMIATEMERMARQEGYGVVREFVGHGIGRNLHEWPQAPAFVTDTFRRHHDFTLVPGMTLAIEPMFTLGQPMVRTSEDGWTVVTTDGMPSCHIEHTIAVSPRGADVLTTGCGR